MRNKQEFIFEVTVSNFIFPGFYDTIFDPYDVLGEELSEEMTEKDYERIQEYEDTVIQNIVNHYKEVLPSCMKIVDFKLNSPKEYNYRNDELVFNIETSYEYILYHFFSYEKENLFNYLKLEDYYDYQYPEALLEVFLEFVPFVDDLDEITLHEKFIYG